MGVACGPSGSITITDNDVIEKSNLNRQFLFRAQHIQQPKSTVAAQSVKSMNPSINIAAHQYKVLLSPSPSHVPAILIFNLCALQVGPETAKTVYTDKFFEGLDIAVNALDNVAARRYMDDRCVSNQRPLLESGTMGAKGHVQVRWVSGSRG